MDIIAAVQTSAQQRPDARAYVWRDETVTHAELWERSGRLAAALERLGQPGSPVVVHGHKQSLMLIGFLASVRSGHPYVPVDTSLPATRVNDIIRAANPVVVLAIGDLPEGSESPVWTADQIEQVLTQPGEPDPASAVGAEDPYYIIFTSGSTGTPKGVQISRASLAAFAGWARTLRPAVGAASGSQAVYLNQAPFSFDLSVFDMGMALASGATLYALDKKATARPAELYEQLGRGGLTTWVSTPSFADLCLADASFTAELLPELELFLFCGETLGHGTASELRRRFPKARVLNTYGPTESTVAVTSIDCTDEVLARYPVLPVGAVKPGTRIQIRDEQGTVLDEGQRGEIVIVGDTVSLGYLNNPELNAKAFEMIDGERAYRTGDAGELREGQLHFGGRLDFQVKLHGYRIEIEDIEANLRRVPGVAHAVVLPVSASGVPGVVDHLVAVVQLDAGVPDSPLKQSVADKKILRGLIPDYMVPKLFKYTDEMPLTNNGKVDRRALETRLT